MTVLPYIRTAHARTTGPSTIDRMLIGAGIALAEWGVRRSTRHTIPVYADQTAGFESRRDAATRALPMLPR
jgi:hypothetical protein